ncbi:hypothetical protein ACFLVZ_01470 [Chloroflexota bacterium]
MTNWLEIAGISLQIIAGFIFILDQIAVKFSTSIEKWTQKAITIMTRHDRRRWRMFILFSLVAIPVILYSFIKFGTNEEITWSTIGGAVIFSIIGFEVYALLLVIVGKKTLKGNIGHHIDSLIREGKIVKTNIILFIVSIILFWWIFYIIGKLSTLTDNNLLRIFIFSLSGFSILIMFPALFFSFLFLIPEGFTRFILWLAVINSSYIWVAIAVSWIVGGGLLLANAFTSTG